MELVTVLRNGALKWRWPVGGCGLSGSLSGGSNRGWSEADGGDANIDFRPEAGAVATHA